MAKKKRIPKGQLNKENILHSRLKKLMKDLGEKYSIRVGIIGSQAYEKHPHADLTMAQLGAIHEFGATINVTDKMRGWFWHNAEIHKSDDPVIIPTRSFLRMPLLSKDGKKEINKVVTSQLSADRELNKIAANADSELLENVANLVGLAALQRVQQAFQTSGFGNWAPISEFTKSRRKGDASSEPLNDSGTLMESITVEVKKHGKKK